MLKRNHAITALLIFFLILFRPSINDILIGRWDIYIPRVVNTNLLLALTVFVGALFPDIDFLWFLRKWHRQLLHNIIAVLIVAILLMLFDSAFLKLLTIIVFAANIFPDLNLIGILGWRKKLPRRILAFLGVIFLLWLFESTYQRSLYNNIFVAGSFAFGSMIHIGEDSLTEHGTYIFWPISRKFKLHWRVSTGTWEEKIAMLLIVALIFVIYFAVSIALNF